MKIKTLKVKNFKNIEESSIEFKSNLAGIYGPNGTGKTAIVEAIEIISLYFNLNKPKEITEKLQKKISKLIMIGKEYLEIEINFESEEYIYCIKVKFSKDVEENIFAESESIEWKEKQSRKKFSNLIQINNELENIIPKIFLIDGKSEDTSFFENEILNKKGIHLRTVINEFNNFNSYIALIYKYVNDIDRSTLNDRFNTFIAHWEKINSTLKMLIVVTLEEQALYNLDFLLPIKVHNENIHGTFTLKYGSSNIYKETIVNSLEEIIQQINTIFSVIIQNSKIIMKKKLIKQVDDISEFAVEIYVVRDGQEIPIENESTGIIKIISLLSTLIYYIQDEKAIIIIDELDIHIFEYLLAIMLEKMSKYAKGQLIFTAHNLLPMEKLNRNSIIISSKKDKEVIYTYLNGTSSTTNLRNKYLRSQSLWSEENIQPLLINEPALDLFLKRLVR